MVERFHLGLGANDLGGHYAQENERPQEARRKETCYDPTAHRHAPQSGRVCIGGFERTVYNGDGIK